MSTSTVKKKEDAVNVADTALTTSPSATTPAVEQAEATLNTQLGTAPSWEAQLDDTMNKIMNREKFTYDLNGDALYNQYKDRFVNQGKMAMMDTMGQSAALTGGYGNSYAQAAGQQAYQGYLNGLNDMIPELYNLAYNKFNDDTNALYKQYEMLGQKEEQAYNRQQEAYGNLQSLIAATGMIPTAEQLAASGMTQEEANALKMAYAAENPDKAYRAGIINDDEYYILTGTKYGASSGGGNYYYTGSDPEPKTGTATAEQLRQLGYAISNERTEEGKAQLVNNAINKGLITVEQGTNALINSQKQGTRSSGR